MGQVPYGTSGLCPHTGSPHIEAAYGATAMHNNPGSLPLPSQGEWRAYMRSLHPESLRDAYDTICYGGDLFEQIAGIGMMAGGAGPGSVFSKVPYASTNLSKLAMEFRRVSNLKTGNIAVFEYIDAAGSLQTIIRRSTRGIKGGGHAERIIGRELERMGINPSQVTRIYSEFEPCIVPANCSRYIQETYPQAEVTYSFEYGASPASRQRGRSALEEAIESIFNLNFFDKVD